MRKILIYLVVIVLILMPSNCPNKGEDVAAQSGRLSAALRALARPEGG